MDRTKKYMLWDVDDILYNYSMMRKKSYRIEARLERSIFREIFPTIIDIMIASEREFQHRVSGWIEARIWELHDQGFEVLLHNGVEQI